MVVYWSCLVVSMMKQMKQLKVVYVYGASMNCKKTQTKPNKKQPNDTVADAVGEVINGVQNLQQVWLVDNLPAKTRQIQLCLLRTSLPSRTNQSKLQLLCPTLDAFLLADEPVMLIQTITFGWGI